MTTPRVRPIRFRTDLAPSSAATPGAPAARCPEDLLAEWAPVGARASVPFGGPRAAS